MTQVNARLKVGVREISDSWNRLRVNQSLGEAMLLEALFVIGAAPSDPKQHFADLLGKPLMLELQRDGHSATLSCLIAQACVHTDGYTLVGRGPLYSLMLAPRSRGYVDQSPKEVIESVLADAGVQRDVRADTPLATTPLPYIAQYGETDFDFVHRLAGWVGLVVYEHDGKVIVAEAPNGPSIRLESFDIEAARIVLEPTAVAGKAVAMDYAPHGETSASVSSIGSSSDSQYRSTLDSPAKALFGGPPAKLSDMYPKSSNGLTDQLRARARQLVGRSIRYEFKTYRPDVQVGIIIDVSGHKLINEKLFVIGISMDRSVRNAYPPRYGDIEESYATRVIAVPAKMVGPVKLPTPPRLGMVCATVADNKDPENLGRVQLKFAWDDKPTVWARVASFSAGASHGAFWVPQPKDEVLVDFESADPSRPIVVGSLYHSDAPPPAETDNGTGEVLLTRTDAGTEIRVLQTKNGEEIRLRVGDAGPEIRMLATDAPNVEISVHGGRCELKAKTIALTAEERVSIQGGTLALNAQGDIKIEAAGTVTINGVQIKLN
jgi:type VI secretion system secreted protein VgrG